MRRSGPARSAFAAAVAVLALAGLARPGAGEPLPARYQISLPVELELDEGQSAALSLTIAPDPGYTVSRTGPLRVALTVSPEPGLDLPRRRYQRSHAADPLAVAPRFDLALRAARAGRYQLTVDLLFWLCRVRSCRPIRTARTVAIAVRPAPAPPSN